MARTEAEPRRVGLERVLAIVLLGASAAGLARCERAGVGQATPVGRAVAPFRESGARPAPPTAVAPAELATLRPDVIVARVDGAAVRGRDLLPFAPEERARQVTADNLGFLLDRAVAAAVVARAAAELGVEVVGAEEARLERLAAALAGHVPPEEAALRLRDVRTMLLRRALLVARPDTTGAELERELRARYHVEVLVGRPAPGGH